MQKALAVDDPRHPRAVLWRSGDVLACPMPQRLILRGEAWLYSLGWGTGLTAEDMQKRMWVRPEVVARIEFLEWTDGDHLRHSKFAGLREDKSAQSVTKEHAGEA